MELRAQSKSSPRPRTNESETRLKQTCEKIEILELGRLSKWPEMYRKTVAVVYRAFKQQFFYTQLFHNLKNQFFHIFQTGSASEIEFLGRRINHLPRWCAP